MSKYKEHDNLTVKELRREISAWPDDAEVIFGSTLAGVPLVFYRFKKRGDKLLQIELNEAELED